MARNFCGTNKQTADMFTKSLPKAKHLFFSSQLGLWDFESRGNVEWFKISHLFMVFNISPRHQVLVSVSGVICSGPRCPRYLLLQFICKPYTKAFFMNILIYEKKSSSLKSTKDYSYSQFYILEVASWVGWVTGQNGPFLVLVSFFHKIVWVNWHLKTILLAKLSISGRPIWDKTHPNSPRL